MNKCEKAWFKHAWENDDYMYWFQIVQRYKCTNCELTRTHKNQIKEWVEYSDWKERPWEHKIEMIPM